MTKSYSMLPKTPILGRTIAFRLATPADAAIIAEMRTDPERSRFISATSPDVDAQRIWLEKYRTRQDEGAEFYFVIESRSTGDPLGLVRMYDFRGSSFCWGSWVVRPGSPATTALESALLIYELAFGPLCFEGAHFDVRKGNARVLAFHDRMGATRVGETDEDILFVYPKAAYMIAAERYSKYLPQKQF